MIHKLLHLVGLARKKASGPPQEGRSPKWPAVRRAFLASHPFCAACGKTVDLACHHKQPFHLFPEKELEPANLITLCAEPCHIVFGHCGDWTWYNTHVSSDAALHLSRVEQAKRRAEH